MYGRNERQHRKNVVKCLQKFCRHSIKLKFVMLDSPTVAVQIAGVGNGKGNTNNV